MHHLPLPAAAPNEILQSSGAPTHKKWALADSHSSAQTCSSAFKCLASRPSCQHAHPVSLAVCLRSQKLPSAARSCELWERLQHASFPLLLLFLVAPSNLVLPCTPSPLSINQSTASQPTGWSAPTLCLPDPRSPLDVRKKPFSFPLLSGVWI